MSVIVRNLQRVVGIRVKQFHMDIVHLKRISGYDEFELGVLLVSNEEIKTLNQTYRNHNEVTDVLAFPFHEIPEHLAGSVPEVNDDEKMLGDIVLGVPYILSDAMKHGDDFNSVMLTMVAHGLFHVVGFDHETPEQWTIMYNKELDILKKFNKLTGYKCSPLLGVGHIQGTEY
ncbi:unnamed protein product [Lymnaea stagnalis]|uniref:Uncharacterized protein n=1 Tax=Lymnaea stagnalis TaxID=6523 RepID=A0AAV2I2C8_LYMST